MSSSVARTPPPHNHPQQHRVLQSPWAAGTARSRHGLPPPTPSPSPNHHRDAGARAEFHSPNNDLHSPTPQLSLLGMPLPYVVSPENKLLLRISTPPPRPAPPNRAAQPSARSSSMTYGVINPPEPSPIRRAASMEQSEAPSVLPSVLWTPPAPSPLPVGGDNARRSPTATALFRDPPAVATTTHLFNRIQQRHPSPASSLAPTSEIQHVGANVRWAPDRPWNDTLRSGLMTTADVRFQPDRYAQVPVRSPSPRASPADASNNATAAQRSSPRATGMSKSPALGSTASLQRTTRRYEQTTAAHALERRRFEELESAVRHRDVEETEARHFRSLKSQFKLRLARDYSTIAMTQHVAMARYRTAQRDPTALYEWGVVLRKVDELERWSRADIETQWWTDVFIFFEPLFEVQVAAFTQKKMIAAEHAVQFSKILQSYRSFLVDVVDVAATSRRLALAISDRLRTEKIEEGLKEAAARERIRRGERDAWTEIRAAAAESMLYLAQHLALQAAAERQQSQLPGLGRPFQGAPASMAHSVASPTTSIIDVSQLSEVIEDALNVDPVLHLEADEDAMRRQLESRESRARAVVLHWEEDRWAQAAAAERHVSWVVTDEAAARDRIVAAEAAQWRVVHRLLIAAASIAGSSPRRDAPLAAHSPQASNRLLFQMNFDSPDGLYGRNPLPAVKSGPSRSSSQTRSGSTQTIDVATHATQTAPSREQHHDAEHSVDAAYHAAGLLQHYADHGDWYSPISAATRLQSSSPGVRDGRSHSPGIDVEPRPPQHSITTTSTSRSPMRSPSQRRPWMPSGKAPDKLLSHLPPVTQEEPDPTLVREYADQSARLTTSMSRSSSAERVRSSPPPRDLEATIVAGRTRAVVAGSSATTVSTITTYYDHSSSNYAAVGHGAHLHTAPHLAGVVLLHAGSPPRSASEPHREPVFRDHGLHDAAVQCDPPAVAASGDTHLRPQTSMAAARLRSEPAARLASSGRRSSSRLGTGMQAVARRRETPTPAQSTAAERHLSAAERLQKFRLAEDERKRRSTPTTIAPAAVPGVAQRTIQLPAPRHADSGASSQHSALHGWTPSLPTTGVDDSRQTLLLRSVGAAHGGTTGSAASATSASGTTAAATTLTSHVTADASARVVDLELVRAYPASLREPALVGAPASSGHGKRAIPVRTGRRGVEPVVAAAAVVTGRQHERQQSRGGGLTAGALQAAHRYAAATVAYHDDSYATVSSASAPIVPQQSNDIGHASDTSDDTPGATSSTRTAVVDETQHHHAHYHEEGDAVAAPTTLAAASPPRVPYVNFRPPLSPATPAATRAVPALLHISLDGTAATSKDLDAVMADVSRLVEGDTSSDARDARGRYNDYGDDGDDSEESRQVTRHRRAAHPLAVQYVAVAAHRHAVDAAAVPWKLETHAQWPASPEALRHVSTPPTALRRHAMASLLHQSPAQTAGGGPSVVPRHPDAVSRTPSTMDVQQRDARFGSALALSPDRVEWHEFRDRERIALQERIAREALLTLCAVDEDELIEVGGGPPPEHTSPHDDTSFGDRDGGVEPDGRVAPSDGFEGATSVPHNHHHRDVTVDGWAARMLRMYSHAPRRGPAMLMQ